MIAAIVGVDSNWGIGSNNDLLIQIPEDMKHFKEITEGGSVIMGRKTWDSLPKKPLKERTNIIITNKIKHRPKLNKDNTICSNMEYIKAWLSSKEVIEENNGIYVIGGGMIYNELLPLCERVYITKIMNLYENADTFFPNIDNMPEWEVTSESEIKEYKGIKYQFCIYDRTDYEIEAIQTIENPDKNLDTIITVKTFNGYKTVILQAKDNKNLITYIDCWDYLKDKFNLLKFLNKIKDYNENKGCDSDE